MDIKDKVEEIKKYVSIPTYFDEIIVPQIGDYYSDRPVDLNNYHYALCPLHNERSPSFRFHEDTNSFYCYGCGVGGDIINLHRKFFATVLDVDHILFKDAVDFLYSYFIANNKGKAEKQLEAIAEIKKEYKNTVAEILRFNRYTNELEEMLQKDNKISYEKKRKIYQYIDDSNILVKIDLIEAKEALKAMKNIVREILKD